MKSSSMSWFYVASLLCAAESFNKSTNVQKHHYLDNYMYTVSNSEPTRHIAFSKEWRTTMEESFLQSENEVGSWNVTGSNGTACILLKGIIKLTINYTDINNKTRLGNIDVPPSANATGNCKNGQYIVLSWKDEGLQKDSWNNTLKFVFKANDKSKKLEGTPAKDIPAGKFAIVEVSAEIRKNEKQFPNATNPNDPLIVAQKGLTVFPTTLSRSFACYAIVTIGSPTEQLTVLLQNTQIEAFRKVVRGQTDNGSFSAAEHCSADEISSGSTVVTVIISIVSIVLIALVVAVLVTYLKKRRAVMSTGSGYETM